MNLSSIELGEGSMAVQLLGSSGSGKDPGSISPRAFPLPSALSGHGLLSLYLNSLIVPFSRSSSFMDSPPLLSAVPFSKVPATGNPVPKDSSNA